MLGWWVPDDLWLSRNLERHVLEAAEYRMIQHGSSKGELDSMSKLEDSLAVPLCQDLVLAGQKSLYNGAVNGGDCSAKWAKSEISGAKDCIKVENGRTQNVYKWCL